MLCSIAIEVRQPRRFDLWTGASEASLSIGHPAQAAKRAKLLSYALGQLRWDERLSGFFHREFGVGVGGVWFGFAAGEDF